MAAKAPETVKLTKDLTRKEIVFAIERVPDTKRYIFGGSDFQVSEIDLGQEKPEARAWGKHESYVTSIALAGPHAVSGGYDGRLIWWDIEGGKQVQAVDAHRKWIRAVTATPDGTVVASVADDMVCRLWDGETGSPLRELRGHAESTPHHFPSMLFACAISPDGEHIATGDKVGHIIVWELRSGKSIATMEAPTMYTWDPVQRRHSIGGIRALAFSPDGTRLAVGGMGQVPNIDHLDGHVRLEVFDWKKAARTHEFAVDKQKGIIEHLQFAPEGDWVMAVGGANDGFLMVADLKTKTIPLLEKAKKHLHDFVLDVPAGTVVAAGHNKIEAYEFKA